MKVLGKYKKIIIFSAAFIVGVFFLSIFFLDSKKVEINNISGKEKEVPEETIEKGESVKKEESLEEKIDQANGKEAEEDEANKADKADDKKGNNNSFSINDKLVSWGYEKAKGRKIDTIVVHSSYDALGNDPYSVSGLLKEYKEYGVAPHYLIDREGKIYRLVEEKNIAYHAGESKVPDGRSGVNNFSIGIEMMNTKSDNYTKSQYSSLKNIIGNIKSRYEIKYTLGHNQIAPGRKGDPWNFDWNKVK